MTTIPLMQSTAGVSAFSTLAGFNICTYAGASADASVAADFSRLEAFAGVGREFMRFPVQTHSTRVVCVDADTEVDLRGVDGVVTADDRLLIGVHTADCLPLLLADPDSGVVGAVHCGWRGIVGGIVGEALCAMAAAGARRLVAAMGPCICQTCFEVGPEVAERFEVAAVDILRRGGKPHVDLARAVALQLRRSGVDRIELPPACSRCSPELYSVRRQGRELPFRTLTAIRIKN